ncbi:hypothetical protein PV327_009136 [Microctonus hyperodae]|uniref:phospholipase A1 n=1 Tax=Microctonus hyperodae TaxID=165561 RepID=A0AA39FU77_MICHY|nr:hypothetical protein PV327_009136 [Microctonus hyperodae]
MLKFTFSTVVIVGFQYFALTVLQIDAQDTSPTDLSSNPLDLISNIQCGPTNLEASRDNVTFYLFTRSNRDTGYILKINDGDNLNTSPFNSVRPTKYIVHGWTDSAETPWVVKIRQYYLDLDDYNIIAVDWSPISKRDYPTATRYAPSIGKIIGDMLIFLNTVGSQSFSDVHMVGHSLGAQVSGFAGAAVSGALARITGLDPAGPCYGIPLLKSTEDRLDSTDAHFVDIIHTDKGIYGIPQVSGHADFYPNGGNAPQPGCAGVKQDSCSHQKSTAYMIESIPYPQQFPAFQCDSWNSYKDGNCANNPVAYMGNACDSSARGKYYLTPESDLVNRNPQSTTNTMKFKLLFLLTIGLFHHVEIVMTLIRVNVRDPLALEKLFRETFNPSSIGLANFEGGTATLSNPGDNVTFYLYTPSNKINAYMLKVGDVKNLNESPFNANQQTKILIHGWTDSALEPWIMNFRDNYFVTGNNYNIIAVNWYPLSSTEYPTAVRYTRPVGEYVGALLQFLNNAAQLSYRNVHILGHSLGAHIAGFAGANVSGVVGRITGMDPAGPLYEFPLLRGSRDRLDPTDAVFVDIIHTCAGAAGFVEAIGHVDFYPNGGTFTQPGCSALQSLTCSHARAYIFMIDSIIYPDEFVAMKCDSWSDYRNGRCSGTEAIMGEHVTVTARGSYYLRTNPNSPYEEQLPRYDCITLKSNNQIIINLFVDVIHTSGSIYGVVEAVGHADFYPNNGSIQQPGCEWDPTMVCSHAWAVVLLFNAIKYPEDFEAVECDSWENYERLFKITEITSVGSPGFVQSTWHSLEIENKFADVLKLIGTVSPTLSEIAKHGIVQTAVKFLLYTKSDMGKPYTLKIGDKDNLNNSPFDSAKETKFFIHGWMDSSLDPFLRCALKNYLKNENYNIIMVDWSILSRNEYMVAVELTRSVGQVVGRMVKFLNTEGGQSLLDIHVIGHSLGAQTAGFAGSYTSGRIGRITGLDPSGPLYEVPYVKDPEDRLDPTDGVFVDNIHTCGGVYGFIEPVGHVDFYPNNGTLQQPGCEWDPTILCSHMWAIVLLYNSFKYPEDFQAVKCDNWENYESGSCSDNSVTTMGEYVDRDARGKFYLKTSPSVEVLC